MSENRNVFIIQRRSQDFSKEGRGDFHSVSESGTHQIVMSFSPPVVGCLLKKSSQKLGGGGIPGSPWLRSCYLFGLYHRGIFFGFH